MTIGACGAFALRQIRQGSAEFSVFMAGTTVATAAVASFLGRAVTQVSFAQGFGLGLLAVPALVLLLEYLKGQELKISGLTLLYLVQLEAPGFTELPQPLLQ